MLLALGIGAALTYGTYELSFTAQETIGGVLSIVATGLVTWMVFWMLARARDLSGHLRGSIDRSLVGSGVGLVVVAFVAVGREGIETALSIWAAVQATGETTMPLLGAALGILLVVAAGVLSYGVHDLQDAGLLPGLNSLAFNVSGAIPPDSWYATLLKGALNFSPATTWHERAVWPGYLVPTLTVFAARSRQGRPDASTAAFATAAAAGSPSRATRASGTMPERER